VHAITIYINYSGYEHELTELTG